MPPSTQVKLLRVLEEREFFRVGGAAPIRVDVRVVTATNRSLKALVDAGEFRQDLYYRLNVLSIYLPPLRERRSDIPLLVRRFIHEFSRQHDRPFRGIAAGRRCRSWWTRRGRGTCGSCGTWSSRWWCSRRPARSGRATSRATCASRGGTGCCRCGCRGWRARWRGRSWPTSCSRCWTCGCRWRTCGAGWTTGRSGWRSSTCRARRAGRGVRGGGGGRGRRSGGGPRRGRRPESVVLYRTGMRMAEVERAAIEAALQGHARESSQGGGDAGDRGADAV